MRNRFTWFASAAGIWFVLGFIGYVGMVFRTLEGIFDRVSAADVMMRGAEWMMIASIVIMCGTIAVALAASRLRIRRTLVDVGLQAGSVLFGALFAWTLAQDALYLIGWAALYVPLFLKPFVIDGRADEPAWRRWGFVGLTSLTAAYIIGFASI